MLFFFFFRSSKIRKQLIEAHPEYPPLKWFPRNLFADLKAWINTMIWMVERVLSEFGNMVGLQLSIGRISQDYVEHLFGDLRSSVGGHCNITAQSALRQFRQVLFSFFLIVSVGNFFGVIFWGLMHAICLILFFHVFFFVSHFAYSDFGSMILCIGFLLHTRGAIGW